LLWLLCAGKAEGFFNVKQFQRFETLLPKAARLICRFRIARQGSRFIFAGHGLSGAYIDYFNLDFTQKSLALHSAGPNSPPTYFVREEIYRKVHKAVSECLELNKVWPCVSGLWDRRVAATRHVLHNTLRGMSSAHQL
jgi:hypothetical protein